MTDNIVDIILNLRDEILCFDYTKAEYMIMLRSITNSCCKCYNNPSISEDTENFLDWYLIQKNNLILHLFNFMNLIEKLDGEIKKEWGDDL